jgi:hypothetical protein
MLQLGDYKLKRIDFVSIGIFCTAGIFLLIYKLAIQQVYGTNTQLIAVFIIGIACLITGVSSFMSLRIGVNSYYHFMNMIGFLFAGILLILVTVFRFVFFKGN